MVMFGCSTVIFFNLIYSYLINEATSEPPNIVLIVADDLGRNDVGYNGANQIPTPNIDALAYNGVILDRFYPLPTCTPSRAALLTGLYPIRYGFQGLPISAGQNQHLPLNVPLLSERLKELGYKTNLIGKWHVGAAYKKVTPTGRGFDYHFGYWYGLIGYFNHSIGAFPLQTQNMTGLDMHDGFEPAWNTQGEYATTLITRKSEEVIENHDKRDPLFLMISHLAVHAGPDGVQHDVLNATENNKQFNYITDEDRRSFAGLVTELDKSVGKIVQKLKEKSMLDNTIIIFISDNGGPSQNIIMYSNSASNWPLRGQKATVLEGGVRCVGIIYSSKLIHKGAVNNNLIHITDLLPTLYSAAGGDVDKLGKIDGINQWSNLLPNSPNPARTEALINIDEVSNSSAIIGENGRFKLVKGATVVSTADDNFLGDSGRESVNPSYNVSAVQYSETNMAIQNIPGSLTHQHILNLRQQVDLAKVYKNLTQFEPCSYDRVCLFDLVNDPCETTNVAEVYPEIVDKLNRKLLTYMQQLVPQINAPIDFKADPIYYSKSWFTWMD